MNETSKARIQCSGCQAGFKVKAAAIGKKVKCPKCETVFVAAPVAARKAVPVAQEQTKSPSPQAVPAAKPVAPSGTKRCNMCHEFIPVDEFDAHYQQHEGLADDGQHNAYPTLPPEERWTGDLRNVPQNYIHPVCGSVTVMPEEITRTYLVNPYFYGYSSFCCGCETHISGKELKWVDTGETLYDYTRRLQVENPNSKKYRNEAIRNLIIADDVSWAGFRFARHRGWLFCWRLGGRGSRFCFRRFDRFCFGLCRFSQNARRHIKASAN